MNTNTSILSIRLKSLTVRYESYGPRNRLPKARVRRGRQRLHVDVYTRGKRRRKEVAARREARVRAETNSFRASWLGLGRSWLAWVPRLGHAHAWARRWPGSAAGLGQLLVGVNDSGLAKGRKKRRKREGRRRERERRRREEEKRGRGKKK